MSSRDRMISGLEQGPSSTVGGRAAQPPDRILFGGFGGVAAKTTEQPGLWGQSQRRCNSPVDDLRVDRLAVVDAERRLLSIIGRGGVLKRDCPDPSAGGGVGNPGFPTPLRLGCVRPDPSAGGGVGNPGFPTPLRLGCVRLDPSAGGGVGNPGFPTPLFKSLCSRQCWIIHA